jgi:hypothetical protein
MKAIGYKIQRLPIQAAAALTEALNNEQRRLNEDEAPMEGDMEPHWEIDNLFPVRCDTTTTSSCSCSGSNGSTATKPCATIWDGSCGGGS